MIVGGKSKYACLLTMIKHESPKLYELVSDLCLDATFRSQRYQNTFLMPSPELVKKIEKLVDNDHDVEAIDKIRSLLLKGHLSAEDFKKGANIGTLQFGSFVLENPEDVHKHLSKSKSEVIVTREGAFATIVLNYKGDDVPKTTKGSSGGNIHVGIMTGGADNKDIEIIKKITKDLIVKDDAERTVINFFKAVSAALAILKKDERFKRAKFYMAANPILAWFFLTMPGSSHGLIKASELANFKWDAFSNFDIIEEAENVDYEVDDSLIAHINKQRRSLATGGDINSLPKSIPKEYESIVGDLLKHGAIDDVLAKNIHLKIRMDELRFLFDKSVEKWSHVDDALAELGLIENYTDPKKRITLCDEQIYSMSLIKGNEAYRSGPLRFVKSVYFLYIPLTKKIEQKLFELRRSPKGGAIIGGNPSAINTVIFSGGAARAALKRKSADFKLSSFVDMLTKAQREELKELL